MSFTLLFITAILIFALNNRLLMQSIALFSLTLSTYLMESKIPLEGFYATTITEIFGIVLAIVIIGVVLHQEKKEEITQTLFLTTASIALLQSYTLISFLISFEALSIISFIIVIHIKNKNEALASIKLFIAGAIATGFIFLGTAIYLFEGHSLLNPIEKVGVFGEIGIWLMLLGLFYKLTIVPFHSWAKDSYANLNPTHTALLSGVAKSVALIGVFKIFSPFLAQELPLTEPILITLALITMTLGNILALFQTRVTKILAYSSIAHAGYMLLIFVAFKSDYSKTALLYIAVAYIFMQTALYLLISTISNGQTSMTLNSIKGLSKLDNRASTIFTIQLLSLAGIPLLAGFLAKVVLVYSVVSVGFPLIALITLLNSALSVGYYAWIVKHLYFDKNEEDNFIKLQGFPLIGQVLLAGGTLFFGIFAQILFI